MAETPTHITTTDLDLVFFRAQDSDGRWITISAKNATSAQFDTWIKTRIEIQGPDLPWGYEERADICDLLYQDGELVILRRDASST